MKHTFDDIFNSYTSKYNRQISRFCEPLKLAYGINYFAYYMINQEGFYSTFGSRMDWMEYFFDQKLYLQCGLFMRHPDAYPNCSFICNDQQFVDDPFEQVQNQAKERFGMQYTLLILRKENDRIEGFAFGTPPQNCQVDYSLINELPVLKIFIARFCEEFKTMMQDILYQGVQIGHLIGRHFYEKIKLFPSDIDQKRQQLLTQLGVELPSNLSKRELQIIPFYIKGLSANQIAKKLYLSPRTIEHYIENLKVKLNCFNKSELINKLSYFHESLDLLNLD